MEPKHITDGKMVIDVKEYRELVADATMLDHYRCEYYRVSAELAKLKENANG
jgi:hypothetical protein